MPTPIPSPNHQLARKLMAAFVSYRLGIGLEYAWKRYVPENPPQFWLDLADALFQMELEMLDQRSRQRTATTE